MWLRGHIRCGDATTVPHNRIQMRLMQTLFYHFYLSKQYYHWYSSLALYVRILVFVRFFFFFWHMCVSESMCIWDACEYRSRTFVGIGTWHSMFWRRECVCVYVCMRKTQGRRDDRTQLTLRCIVYPYRSTGRRHRCHRLNRSHSVCAHIFRSVVAVGRKKKK